MKLLSDDLLGFLWATRSRCLELGKQCDLIFNFADETRRFLPLLLNSYNNNSIPRFAELKFYVNRGTLIKLDALIDSQKQKLSACMDGAIITGRGHSGIEHLRQNITKFNNLRRKISKLVINKEKVEITSGDPLYNPLYAIDDRGSYLIQVLYVSDEGYILLDKFLNEYVTLYSSRDLEGQETLELPTKYSTMLKSYIYSRVAKYGSTKIPVNLVKPFVYPLHSLLYLDNLGYISVKKIRRKEDPPTSGSGTIYRPLYWEWQAIVDITRDFPQVSSNGDDAMGKDWTSVRFDDGGNSITFDEHNKVSFFISNRTSYTLFKFLIETAKGEWRTTTQLSNELTSVGDIRRTITRMMQWVNNKERSKAHPDISVERQKGKPGALNSAKVRVIWK